MGKRAFSARSSPPKKQHLPSVKSSSKGLQCSEELRQKTGGLGYREMVEMADNARFRYALWQMGEAVGELMEQVVRRQPLLDELPQDPGPSWSALSRRWRR